MIYLLRHGQILTGNEFRLVGQRDLPLTELGLRQAAWWGEELAEVAWQGVYSSDLSRTRGFAAIAAGREPEEVNALPELREILLGDWEGLSRAELAERYPQQWEQRGRDISGYRPEGGESFVDVQERALPAFERIAAAHPGDDVMVVAHAGVNRTILCALLGMDLGNLFELEQDYGCLNLIEAGDGGLRVMSMNLPCGAR